MVLRVIEGLIIKFMYAMTHQRFVLEIDLIVIGNLEALHATRSYHINIRASCDEFLKDSWFSLLLLWYFKFVS